MILNYVNEWRLDTSTGKIVVPDVINVSEGKPVFGEDNVVEGKLLKYINDGLFDEFNTWAGDTPYYQQNKVPYSVVIDLEDIYDLSRIDISFKQHNGSEAYYGYLVKGSNDNENWVTIVDETNNKTTGFKSNLLKGKYRYVELEILSARNAHNNNSTASWSNGLMEVQVFANRDEKEMVVLPQANIGSGIYVDRISIELSTITDGASIYYTLDGSEPTNFSTLYTEPIIISKEETVLKAVAYKEGMSSSGVMTEVYEISNANNIVEIIEPLNFSLYTDEGISGLPKTLRAKNLAGDIVEEAVVVWDTEGLYLEPYTTVEINGTMDGGLKITANVSVINKNLVYFIDSGNRSESVYFESAKAKLGSQLLNDKHDQKYESGSWGYTGEVGVDIGYRDGDGIYGCGWYAHDNKNIDYTLPLEAGTYKINTGYREWWGATRGMKLSASVGDSVLETKDFTTNSSTSAVKHSIEISLDAAEDVSISISKNSHSEPVLAWLSVEKILDEDIVEINIPSFHSVYKGSSPESLPSIFKAENRTGETEDVEVVWNTSNIGFNEEYKTIRVYGTVIGFNEPVNINIEVVPKNLIYFIDSGLEDGEMSPSYNAISDLASELKNKVPDKAYEEGSWGYNIEKLGKKATSDFDDKYATGWYGKGSGENAETIIYKIPLEKGEYTVTAGFREWWAGPRYMQISVVYTDENGQRVTHILDDRVVVSNESGGYNQNEISVGDFVLPVDCEIEYHIELCDGTEAPVISWLAIEKVEDQLVEGIDNQELIDNDYILYFVNAGDPTPDTVEDGDKLGLFASSTEQIYKEDEATGKVWGLETKTSSTNVSDSTNKMGSLRYYNGEQVRDKALAYSFELPEGKYDVTFGFKNPWSGRNVSLMAEGERLSEDDYPIGEYGAEKEVTYRQINVDDGELNLRIQGPSTGNLSNYNDPLVSYIIIRLSVIVPVSDLVDSIDQAKIEVSNTEYTKYSREVLINTIIEAEKLVELIGLEEIELTDPSIQDKMQRLIKELSILTSQLEVYEEYTSFRPGEVWNDTNGAPIQAHGAGVIFDENTQKYYWYGEDKTHGYLPARGVRVYSSTDLYNWDDEGLALKAIESMDDFENDSLINELYADLTQEEKAEVLNDIGTDRVIERPKVIYNDSTQKYVMWMHIDGPTDYSTAMYAKAHAGCAISDSPTGPFVFLDSYRMDRAPEDAEYNGQPNQPGMARDMTLFKDDDGTGYIIYSSEENMTIYISKLTESYTDITGWHKDGNEERDLEYKSEYGVDYVRVFPGAQREAPAMFKYQGKYYMITSGATGWDPNVGKYTVADNIFGEWKPLRDIAPGSGTTFDSQPTNVIPIDPEVGKFIYMGDRWIKNNLEDSRYVWLPIEFGEDDEISLKWYDEWTLEDLEGMGKITVNTQLPNVTRLGQEVELPEFLEVRKSDGTIINTPVKWDVDSDTFSKPGIVSLVGKLTELNNKEIKKDIYIVPYTDALFVNCGGATTQDYLDMISYMQDILINKNVIDQQYDAENDQLWGFVGDNTNTSGSSSGDMFNSLRYLTSGNEIKYKFNLDNGSYSVYIGLYDPWAQWSKGGRRADIKLNGVVGYSDYVFTSSRDVLGIEDVNISDGILELVIERSVNASASDSDPQISWIMIVSNKSIDKSDLFNVIDQVGMLDKKLYEEPSWNVLKLAFDTANYVNENAYATQAEVDNATENLKNAIDNLIVIEPDTVDKTKLVDKIEEVQVLDQKLFTQKSYNNLIDILQIANIIMDDTSANQQDVDDVLLSLSEAIDGLVLIENDKPEEEKEKPSEGELEEDEKEKPSKGESEENEKEKSSENPTDKDVEEDIIDKDKEETSPKTGDIGVGIYVIPIIIGLAIIVALLSQKRKYLER